MVIKQALLRKKRYKELFGPIVDNSIFTISDVDSSWNDFSTENLFSANDKLKLIKSKFTSMEQYDKVVFNRVIQENLINKEIFAFDASTISNFQKLFSFCAEKIKG